MLITNLEGNVILGRSMSNSFWVTVALGESLSNICALYAFAYTSKKKRNVRGNFIWKAISWLLELRSSLSNVKLAIHYCRSVFVYLRFRATASIARICWLNLFWWTWFSFYTFSGVFIRNRSTSGRKDFFELIIIETSTCLCFYLLPDLITIDRATHLSKNTSSSVYI